MNANKLFIYSSMRRYSLKEWNALPMARKSYRASRDFHHDFFILQTASGKEFRYQKRKLRSYAAQVLAMVFVEARP